jgi:hypothetical protein
MTLMGWLEDRDKETQAINDSMNERNRAINEQHIQDAQDRYQKMTQERAEKRAKKNDDERKNRQKYRRDRGRRR